MSVSGMLVADSDMHVMEPGNLWKRYMDPSWGALTPIGLEDTDRDMRVRLKSVIQPQRGASSISGNPYNPHPGSGASASRRNGAGTPSRR